MTTSRDFILRPQLAINPESIPAGIPIGRNQSQGAHDFPRIPVTPAPVYFYTEPDVRALPPLSALYNMPRTWTRSR